MKQLMYLLLLLGMTFCGDYLFAQNTWTGNANTNWNNTANWSLGTVPTATDDVNIPNVTNDPVIMAGTAAVAKSVGIQSGAVLTVQAMASLSIEGGSGMLNYAIYNLGSVSNSGTITIGATLSPGFYGIQNLGTFTNQAGANITINRGSTGIRHAMGTFTNGGTIKIGDVASLSSNGVYNEADFQNLTTGVLEISRAGSAGFHNLATGTLTNAGTITFGKEASFFGPAFYNFNTIENQAGATINIDRTGAGINNNPNTSFTNEGLIVIGANFALTGNGIYNQEGATFLNDEGEIRIDRFSAAAIDNRRTSIFTTTGLIVIGANEVSFAGPGIYNSGGNFTNDGGEIRIDRVFSAGINNTFGSIFINPNLVYTAGSFSNINDGIITIGANAASAITGPGIYNESAFDGSVISTFLNEGTISINRTIFGIHNNNHSSFMNTGDITVGDVAMNGGFGGPGITNYGTFMHNDGTIQIDRTASGIHNQSPFNGTATFTNADTIIIGSIADITNGPGITNYATFNNNTGGYITIDRVAITNTNTSAVWNGNGASNIFNNNGELKIGTLANIGNIGITVENQSTFNNLADGEITIERTARLGIYISASTSTLHNQGTIDIGLSTSIGERGIMLNRGLLKNEGNITIDRATIHGIYHNNGTLENSGTIDIGKTIGVGTWGFYVSGNSPIINNLAGGKINIDNTTTAGLRNDYGTFTNAGKLNIGSLASVGNWGLWNQKNFTNTATGEIHINRSTTSGLHNVNFNGSSLFNNYGKIYIGDLAAVGTEALNNYHDPNFNAFNATFRNEACALLEINAPLNNTDIFVNEGLMRVNTAAAHTNTTGFTNNGVIEYAQVNPIPNVTNNDVIIEPVDALCPSDVIQIGGMNSFTIATTWYQDEALTMPAGTYNAGANTFTPAGLSTGTHTLYFEITDNVNTCTQLASIQINIFSLGIVYVDEDATGDNNGTSWADAYNDLQDALTTACECGGVQIWVAQGTYYPDEGIGKTDNDRHSTFQLCNNVKLYGGFQGIDSDDELSDADPAQYKTTLSGDLLQNDQPGFVNYGDNARNVVIINNVGGKIILDGFYISAGEDDRLYQGSSAIGRGAGIYILANGEEMDVEIRRCVIQNNRTNYQTAGLSVGVAFTFQPPLKMRVIDCVFDNNNADRASALSTSNLVILDMENCVFVRNSTNGNVNSFGTVYLSNNNVVNCTFDRNERIVNGSRNTLNIFNSILLGNIVRNDGTIHLANTVLSTAINDLPGTINNEGGNTVIDPMLPLFFDANDPDGADNCWRTADDGLVLANGSQAINKGNNTFTTATKDITGAMRIIGENVDLGAYESPCPTISADIAGTTTICPSGNTNLTVTITDGTAPYTIVYSPDGGNTEVTVNDYESGANIAVTPAATTTYTLVSVTDANGCVATTLSGSAVVTVEDVTNPIAVCKAATITLNDNGTYTLQASEIDNNSSDNCGITKYTLSKTDFTCADIGKQLVKLTVEDAAGLKDECSVEITVLASAACEVTIANAGGPSIEAPCTCSDVPGLFDEEIIITGNAENENWVLSANSGFLDPATGNPYPSGTAFIYIGNNQYSLVGRHAAGVGFNITATSEFYPNDPQTISNKCDYPSVEAGNAITICQTKPVNLVGVGQVTNATGIWSTSGDGQFVGGTKFGETTAYIPGVNDKKTGKVILTLTADSDLTNCDFTDQLIITILKTDCGQFPWNGNK